MRDFPNYRAWDIYEKRMIYCGQGGQKYWYAPALLIPTHQNPKESDFIWMQGTGVLDNYHVEVYEGDLVRVSRANSYLDGIYEVYWSDRYTCFGYRTNSPKQKSGGQPYILRQPNIEVLGNIYEPGNALKQIELWRDSKDHAWNRRTIQDFIDRIENVVQSE